jgi:hypothetical protein
MILDLMSRVISLVWTVGKRVSTSDKKCCIPSLPGQWCCNISKIQRSNRHRDCGEELVEDIQPFVPCGHSSNKAFKSNRSLSSVNFLFVISQSRVNFYSFVFPFQPRSCQQAKHAIFANFESSSPHKSLKLFAIECVE